MCLAATAGNNAPEMLRTVVGCEGINMRRMNDQWYARCGHTEAGGVGAKSVAGAGSATG